MKKQLLLPFFLLALSGQVAAADTFHRGGWGESESALRRGASSPLHAESPAKEMRALFVNDRVAGLDAWTIYLLDHDSLIQTRILFAQEHLEADRYLAEYARVGEELRRRYGRPVESREERRGGAVPEESEMGRLVAVGEVTLLSRWETRDTVITHVLHGKNLDIDHEINYMSRRTAPAGSPVMDRLRPPTETRS